MNDREKCRERVRDIRTGGMTWWGWWWWWWWWWWFSTGIALAVGVWNYTFHPMRMTNAILPGHTSLGTIKGSANHARPLSFPFLPPCWQQGVTGRREREHFSLYPGTIPTEELFISREHISTFVPLLLLGDHSLSIISPSYIKWTPNHLAEYKIPAQPLTIVPLSSSTHNTKENFVSSSH